MLQYILLTLFNFISRSQRSSLNVAKTTEQPRTSSRPSTKQTERPKNTESGRNNLIENGSNKKSNSVKGEEEDLAELKNLELNGSQRETFRNFVLCLGLAFLALRRMQKELLRINDKSLEIPLTLNSRNFLEKVALVIKINVIVFSKIK